MARHASLRDCSDSLFHVAATERGQERDDLPLWALLPSVSPREAFGFLQDSAAAEVVVRDVSGVSGGFQLLNLLDEEECHGFVQALEALGFHTDAAVSLPYSFRHMSNCNVVVPEEVDTKIFERCRHLLPHLAGYPPLGLNPKFRCYKYLPGDYFRPHTDGAWPGTRFRDGRVVPDAYGDRLSQLTFLILLSGDYEGGSTRFHQGAGVAADVETRTPLGAALVFPHGHHPDSPLHQGSPVISGAKYMIRTEVLYSLDVLNKLSSL